MTDKDLDHIKDVVEIEGFDYAFASYSNFPEVKDEEFHRLRKAFLKAREELIEYLDLEDC